jgi:hypothetical protein
MHAEVKKMAESADFLAIVTRNLKRNRRVPFL